jgi:hypothetical protein
MPARGNYVTDPTLDEAFQVPLTDEQLKELGRLTAIYSQIDHILGAVLSLLMKIDHKEMELLLDNMMMGTRLSLLRRQLDKFKDENTRKLATKFVENMDRFLGKRNHITHGIWGYYQDEKSMRRASYFAKAKDKPIYAKDLKAIADAAWLEARRIRTVFANLTNLHPPPGRASLYIFGAGPPPKQLPEIID